MWIASGCAVIQAQSRGAREYAPSIATSQCLQMYPKEKIGELVKRSGDAKAHPAAAVVLERGSRPRTKIPEGGANHRRRIAPIATANHPVRARVCSSHV